MGRWLTAVLLVVLIAGVLFGYDQGVISGALAGIEATFSLSIFMLQVVTSWVTLGALLGSLVAGELGDRLGRKRTVLVAGSLFTLGALVQFVAPSALVLVIGRLVIGSGVGVAAVAAPLYAAELAPAKLRGRFVSAYQMAITAGIFMAYLINGQLSSGADWRLMLGAAGVPGLALIIAAFIAPESPRWLIMKGRLADASQTIRKLQPGADAAREIAEIEAAAKSETSDGSWREVLLPEFRRPLFIAIGLAVFQQVTGINAIIYYANEIFSAAGYATESSRATVTLWAVGGVNVVATLIAIAFIDRVGRRQLLLWGLVGMGLSLSVVGLAFRFKTPGFVTVVALVVFIASFAFSLGPVTWTVINEVFPSRIRSHGVALATAVNWGSAWVVSQFFLSIVALIGSAFTFGLPAVMCVVGWLWVNARVPETKGQTLEQIQKLWS